MSASAWIYVVAANVLGGSSYLGTAWALTGFSPIEMVFWRMFIAVFLFSPIVVRALRRRRYSGSEWRRMTAVALFGYAAPLLVGAWGQSLSTSSNASLLIGIEPVSIILLSAIFFGERLAVLQIAAVAAGLAGATLIASQGVPFLGREVRPFLLGDLLLILHGILWSLYSVIGKPVLETVEPMEYTAITSAIGVVPIALAALPALAAHHSLPPAKAVIGISFLGIGVSYACFIVWNKALELVPASKFANFIFMQPLIGVLLGVAIEHDPFTGWSAVGGLLILSSVYLGNLRNATAGREAVPTAVEAPI